MGKASSNKKVARAAGIGGGRTYRRNKPWGYFGVIGLIVVLGVATTYFSRNDRIHAINNAGKKTEPAVGTTWHEGYAVYLCDKFAGPISSKNNPQGISTSQPGIITISPKTDAAAGKNATLGKFATAVGMKLNAAELQVPGGKDYLDRDSCKGQPGHVYVMQFAFPGAATGQLYNGNTKRCKTTGEVSFSCGQLPKLDPRNIPLHDQQMLVIAFVPQSKATSIPAPPKSISNALNALAASSTSSTTTSLPSITPTTPASTATTKPSSSTTKK